MTTSLAVQPRNCVGTSGAREVRRQGLVPGIIYGGGQPVEPFSVEEKALTAQAHSGKFFSTIYQLEINGKKENVLPKAIQFHPITDRLIHVDFLRVEKDAKIHVSIPITYTNEDKSPGIKRGGVLNIILHTLEVVCPANAIPEKLTVDLSELGLNQSIHLDALKLDKDVRVAHPERDNTLATLVPPSGLVEEAAPAAPTEASEASTS